MLPPRRGGRTPYAELAVINPGKGLNSLISENLIDDKEASDLENIQYVESGAPAKAYGYDAVGNILSNNPRGMGFYNDTANSNRYLLTVDGTILKYLNGNVWTPITGASFDSSSIISFNQARGSMYVWDNVSGGAQLSGSTLSRPGTIPSAAFSIFYHDYHCAAGVTSQPNRLYISVNTDASDFTNGSTTLNNSTEVPGASVFSGSGANFVDVSKDDGDKITGLGKFQDVLIVFKERSIYQLTFAADGTPTVAAVTKSYGCMSHRSIDNADNDLIFLTRNGFYVLGNEPNYFNVIRTNELSARIHPTIETITASNFSKTAGIYYKYVYYCGVPSGGTTSNNTTITYDRRYLAWSVWTHVQPESFVTFIDSSNNEYLYFTATNSQKVYKMSTNYSADNGAISAQYSTKAYDLGDFDTYKRWIDVTIFFRQLVGTISISIVTDNGTVAKQLSISTTTNGGIGRYVIGTEMVGGELETVGTTTISSNNIPYRIRLSLKARAIKLIFSNDRINETFVILGYKFTYRKYSHFTFPSSLKVGSGGGSVTVGGTIDDENGNALELE